MIKIDHFGHAGKQLRIGAGRVIQRNVGKGGTNGPDDQAVARSCKFDVSFLSSRQLVVKLCNQIAQRSVSLRRNRYGKWLASVCCKRQCVCAVWNRNRSG